MDHRPFLLRSGSLSHGLCTGMLCSMLILWAIHAFAAPAEQYTVTVLPPGIGNAIDRTGHVVVGDQLLPQTTASILFPTLVTLGFLPGGTSSSANAVFQDRVCGMSSLAPLVLLSHAFDTRSDDSLEDLGTLGSPDLFSACTGLNATKRVGFADSPNRQELLPVVFEQGTVTIRSPLGGVANATGVIEAVSTAGDECGESDTREGDTHATCWFTEDFTTPVDLDRERRRLSFTHALNNARRVVGAVIAPTGLRCFIWEPDTGLVVQATLPGDAEGICNDVNTDGDVVGKSQLHNPGELDFLHEAAVIYDIDGTPIDLSTRVDMMPAGCTFQTASAISDNGRIVVNGTCEGSEHQAFLLTPSTLLAETALEAESVLVADETKALKKRHHHKRQRQMQKWMQAHPHVSQQTKRMVNEAMSD